MPAVYPPILQEEEMTRGVYSKLFVIGLALSACAERAAADPVADFYKGQRVTITVGSAAGGDYDVWARMMARYMSKHLPGNPSFVVQNMPGAGGIRATNSMFNLAPKDGTALAMTSRNATFKALAGDKAVQFDPVKLNWIGSPETTSRVCIVSDTSPVQRASEMFEKEVIMAGAGEGSALSTVPPMLNRLLGAKMKLVEGYQSSIDAKLAMDRGEVHGLCQSLSQIRRSYGPDIASGRLRYLLSMEEDPIAGVNAPSIYNFAKSDQHRQVFALFSTGVRMGRPMFAPPGLPVLRVAALRDAFTNAVRDPELNAEAERQGLVVTLVPGAKIAEMVDQLMKTAPEIRDLAGNIGD